MWSPAIFEYRMPPIGSNFETLVSRGAIEEGLGTRWDGAYLEMIGDWGWSSGAYYSWLLPVFLAHHNENWTAPHQHLWPPCNNRLNPIKPWDKINLSSFRLSVLVIWNRSIINITSKSFKIQATVQHSFWSMVESGLCYLHLSTPIKTW